MFKNKCYLFQPKGKVKWQQAKEACHQQYHGSNLAVINK